MRGGPSARLTSMKPAELLEQKGMVPWLAPYAGWLLEVLEYNGIPYRVTSVFRSREKQQQLWDRFVAGIHAYPVARPGTSRHEVGRAMDISVDPFILAQLGAIWQRMGGFWSPKDEIHFSA